HREDLVAPERLARRLEDQSRAGGVEVGLGVRASSRELANVREPLLASVGRERARRGRRRAPAQGRREAAQTELRHGAATRHRRSCGVAGPCRSSPSRTKRTSTLSPARCERRANVRSSSVPTCTPPKRTSTSPARSPACSAGLPARTPLTFTPARGGSPKSGTTPKNGP